MAEEHAGPDTAVRHGYAQVGDVRLHYAECGEGERLVVLLHGFPECWYSWRKQLPVLGERYRVVAPDMRGYNLSDKPERVDDYRMSRLVDDVTGLIRHFGASEAAVVGHDWGGAVAWAVAQHYPDYVWKLASLQTPPPAAWARNLTLKQMLRSWYMFFFQLPRVPEWWMARDDFAALAKALRATSRPGTFSDKDIEVYKSAMREPGALAGAVNYYRANFRSFFGRRFGEKGISRQERVRVPTLFVYGERDFAILPETVAGVADYVDAPFTELRLGRSNHWVQQESPTEVNAALLSFLDG
ncbi:MAG: alpha/beta hydrolase [Acidobacteria bacterium]|nr:alpha/beta hydrolase [Acidobacteriota bacterium]